MIRILLVSLLAIGSAIGQVPTRALTFGTNITILNANSSQTNKIRTAEGYIKEVIASEEFRNAVLNHTYGGEITFVDNEGLSNLQIYNKILVGAEELNRNSNNTMDMGITTYYENTSTVGWTSTGSPNINMNTKFLDSYTASQATSNMMHEWLHKLGFSHTAYYSTSRDYSVPYAIGTIMDKLAYKASIGTLITSPTPNPTPATLMAPTNVVLSTSSTNVSLTWSAASAATSYKIYRKLESSTTPTLEGTTTNLSFSQIKPIENAIYYVRSVDKDGNTMKSVEVSFKVNVTLSAPTNLILSKRWAYVALKWSAASGAVSYKIYRKLSSSTSTYLQGTTANLSFYQFKPSTSAVYYVQSIDASGKTMKSNEVNFTP